MPSRIPDHNLPAVSSSLPCRAGWQPWSRTGMAPSISSLLTQARTTSAYCSIHSFHRLTFHCRPLDLLRRRSQLASPQPERWLLIPAADSIAPCHSVVPCNHPHFMPRLVLSLPTVREPPSRR